MTQAISAESQTSPITRASTMSSSVIESLSGTVPCMAWVTIVVIDMPTAWISLATLASANMNARVRASVSLGSPCMPRVSRLST